MDSNLISSISIVDLENAIARVVNRIIQEQGLINLNQNDDLITRNDTAKILKISLPTLHNWTKIGLLPSYKVSSRVRYKRSEIMELFNSGDLYKFNRF